MVKPFVNNAREITDDSSGSSRTPGLQFSQRTTIRYVVIVVDPYKLTVYSHTGEYYILIWFVSFSVISPRGMPRPPLVSVVKRRSRDMSRWRHRVGTFWPVVRGLYIYSCICYQVLLFFVQDKAQNVKVKRFFF